MQNLIPPSRYKLKYDFAPFWRPTQSRLPLDADAALPRPGRKTFCEWAVYRHAMARKSIGVSKGFAEDSFEGRGLAKIGLRLAPLAPDQHLGDALLVA